MTIAGGWRLLSNGVDGERETTPPLGCAPETASKGTWIGMAWLPCTRVLTTSSGKVASHPTVRRERERQIIASYKVGYLEEENLLTPATPPATNSAGHESVVISISTWASTFDPL